MNQIKESQWKKYTTFIKDIILIVMFLSSTIGWIRSETIKRTKMEEKIEQLSIQLQENTKQLEKINEILYKQQELNGKIIQFMQNK